MHGSRNPIFHISPANVNMRICSKFARLTCCTFTSFCKTWTIVKFLELTQIKAKIQLKGPKHEILEHGVFTSKNFRKFMVRAYIFLSLSAIFLDVCLYAKRLLLYQLQWENQDFIEFLLCTLFNPITHCRGRIYPLFLLRPVPGKCLKWKELKKVFYSTENFLWTDPVNNVPLRNAIVCTI